jgi:hypothetical protein
MEWGLKLGAASPLSLIHPNPSAGKLFEVDTVHCGSATRDKRRIVMASRIIQIIAKAHHSEILLLEIMEQIPKIVKIINLFILLAVLRVHASGFR